jgi:cytochrome c556
MEINIEHIIIAVIGTVCGYTGHWLDTRREIKRYQKAIKDASGEMNKLMKQIKK